MRSGRSQQSETDLPHRSLARFQDSCSDREPELGAQAAQIGTAFLACEESAAHPAHRAALFSPRATSTTLTRAFSGRLARGLRNRWTDSFATQQHRLPPFPITSWFSGQLREAAIARNEIELVSLWSGQIAPILRHRHAGALMQALIDGLSAPSTPTLHQETAS